MADLPASDTALLDLLRQYTSLSVAELAEHLQVTATAVRQRLTRLRAQELIERRTVRAGRGRPSHRYSLTEQGQRRMGSNFADLAVVLWQELRAVEDPEVRRGLIRRVAQRLSDQYAGRIPDGPLTEKMDAVAEVFTERRVPFTVDDSGQLPVLTAQACPYPDLADRDRSICAFERLLLTEMLGEGMSLTQCRLDGATCCTFEPTSG